MNVNSERVIELFGQAMAKASAEERAAFLDEADLTEAGGPSQSHAEMPLPVRMPCADCGNPREANERQL